MARKRVHPLRTKVQVCEAAAEKLMALHESSPRTRDELRAAVRTVVELTRDVRELSLHLIGALLPENSASERILSYFRMYVGEEIEGEELGAVSAISEYPRRIREWRVQFGWPIRTAGSCYVLERDAPDGEAANLWTIMNNIRRTEASARDRMLALFLALPGEVITTAQLRYVAENKDMRRVRELRTQLGYRIMTRRTGRPDLKPDAYILVDPTPVEEHDRNIDHKVIIKVLQRDGSRCQKTGCLWHPHDRVQGDPRQYIELHHKTWHEEGGANDPQNLVTLCNVHHKDVHRQRIGPGEFDAWLRRAD